MARGGPASRKPRVRCHTYGTRRQATASLHIHNATVFRKRTEYESVRLLIEHKRFHAFRNIVIGLPWNEIQLLHGRVSVKTGADQRQLITIGQRNAVMNHEQAAAAAYVRQQACGLPGRDALIP